MLPGPDVPPPAPVLAAAELPTPPRRGSALRLALAGAFVVLGLAGLAASVFGVVTQVLPRTFSPAQQHQIMSWEVASRWRDWPASRIFPATVGYQLPAVLFGTGAGLSLTAHRVGVAPQAGCAAAVDPALAQVLDRRGCATVLRSTYTDSTGSLVVTVGVVVMRGAAPAAASLPAGSGLRPTVRAVPFRDTLATRFADAQRQVAGGFSRGPYLVLYAAGYTAGRPYDREPLDPYTDSEMTSLGSGVAQSIGARLAAAPPVPHCPGAPGC